MLEVQFENIPGNLKWRAQWVVWRMEDREDSKGRLKSTKVPYNARTGGKAMSSEPSTWCDFNRAGQAARSGEYDGVGFVFSEDDGLCGIDMDHVIDPDTGEVDERAREILRRFKGTYCEISPSGTGLRIFVIGKPERCGKNTGTPKWLEIYDHTSPRYLTVTGHRWAGSHEEATEQPEALEWLHGLYFAPAPPTQKAPQSRETSAAPAALDMTDSKILERAFAAKNGGEFARLWRGDFGDRSHSEADASLCSHLAFWCRGNSAQMDRMFRASGLMRDKWDVKHGADGRTYGEMTIDFSIERCRNFYEPRPSSRPDVARGEEPPVSFESGGDSGGRGAGRSSSDDGWMPVIRLVPGEAVRIVDEMEVALYGDGPAVIYQRGGMHCRISTVDRAVRNPHFGVRASGAADVTDEWGVSRESGSVVVSDASPVWVREQLHRRAKFAKWNRRRSEWEDCDLRPEYVETMLARPESPAPVLRGIVEAPLMRRDGSVLMAPGYDPVSQVYFHSALSDWEAPPARAAGAFDPIADPFIRAAKAEFEDLFGPFSPEEFKTDDGRPAADFSALVAAVLTALMRPELGPAPGFFIGAPTPASGKSFLAHIISIIATGREAPMMTLPQDDTALEDALFSSLRAADAIICIDNLEKPLVSQALNAMLTTPVFSRRVKGVHENQTVRPSMTTFILTGNNPQVWGDGTTRWLYPRINPCCERPQDRKFDRDPLVYTKANRKRLVWAGLTLLKGYADAGRPSQGVSSRFGVWSDWVRSCLMWAGFADPCLTMDRWTATDEVKSGLAALLESWFEKYQMVGTGMSRPRTCGDVIKDLCPNDEQLTNAIVGMAADSKGNPDPRRLGNKLKQWPGRIESGTSGLFRLVMCSAKKAGALQWQVEKVS